MVRARIHCARLAMALLAVAVLLPSTGCLHRVLATMIYVASGTDVPADYKGLEKQRVVVLCRPPSTLEYRYGTADRDLVRAIHERLLANVSKIDLVPDDDVENWTDQREWEYDDLDELALAMKADKILLVELEQFSLLKGSTLYQGRASVTIKVLDMKDEVKKGRVAFIKSLPEFTFPVNSAVPSQEQELVHFQRQYIGVLADRISRHFYPHDERSNFANDSMAHE